MARNEALSRLRARGSRPQRLAEHVGEEPDLAGLFVAAPGPDLDARVMVEGAMSSLTERDQLLLRDAFFLGLSHGEIAQRRELPLGTVKTRVRRALVSMRRYLEGS